MQGRNRDADMRRDMCTGGAGEDRTDWEIRTDAYMLPCVTQMARGTCCMAQKAQLGAL